jgi:hypothetical protein
MRNPTNSIEFAVKEVLKLIEAGVNQEMDSSQQSQEEGRRRHCRAQNFKTVAVEDFKTTF